MIIPRTTWLPISHRLENYICQTYSNRADKVVRMGFRFLAMRTMMILMISMRDDDNDDKDYDDAEILNVVGV